MPATRKVQTQLLVDLKVRQRADALALVLHETRAEILRKALEGRGLQQLEHTYREELSQLDPIAERAGLTRLDLAGLAAEQKIDIAELRSLYPTPSVPAND